MSANAVPPLVLSCHCAVNGRLPEALAANTAGSPTHTVRAVGWFVVTTGSSGTPDTLTGALPLPGGSSTTTMRWPWVVSPGATTTS